MHKNNLPKISVIIASKNSRQTIEECLASIEKQKDHSVEIIVADQSNDGTSQYIENRFPGVKLIKLANPVFTPELWSAGISAASGEIVAITIAQCTPAANWVSKIIEKLKPPYSAVGGAIENDKAGSLGDWALYFCRYSNYMLPFDEKDVCDMAADNAAYNRSALEPYKEIIKNGFWENFVNSAMIKDGLKILLTPEIVTVHKKSFGIIPFSIQRFLHGSYYGQNRSIEFSLIKRLVFVCTSPLIPFIHLKRIIRRVLNRNRQGSKLILSFPILFIFIISWSIGECFGYISGIIGKHGKS